MKNKIFALSLLVASCMTSCSDSNVDSDGVSTEQNELMTYKLKASVIFPQEVVNSLTRGDDDGGNGNNNGDGQDDQIPDDGDNKEWNVDNSKVFFALYNAYGIALTPGNVENELEWKKDEDEQITILSNLMTIHSQQRPQYLVVFVNLDKEHTNFMGQNLEELLTGQTGSSHFRPGHDYLSAALEPDATKRETFYQRPASFRNMLLERYANLQGNDGQGEFFMLNSSWNSDWKNDDEGHYNIRAVDVSKYVFLEKEFPADPADALVYIERVVAKVNTTFASDLLATKVGGTNEAPVFKIAQKPGYNKDTYDGGKPYAPAEYYVKFDGWQLNATNKSFIPLKDIGRNPFLLDHIAGNDYQSFRTGRSYWAFDQNYDYVKENYVTNQDFDHDKGWSYGNRVPQLNYYTLTNMKRLKFGDYSVNGGESDDIADYTDYCFENTMNGDGTEHTDAVTHVLIRAQYVKDADGKRIPYTENIYRVAKTIYEEEGLRNYIFSHLNAMYPSEVTSIDQVVLKHNNKDFYDHNDVKTHVVVDALVGTSYTDSKGVATTVPSDDVKENGSIVEYAGDVTELVFGEATVYTFERGVCYYSIPIKHFAYNHSIGQEGYYGVVRNHWYKVEISQIDAFGHPATPGDAPGDKTDPNYDPDKPYDPQNPGETNPEGGNPGTDDKNPTDPDNPRNDPNNPDPSNPHGDNPGKPIIPEDTTDDDYNLSVRIKVLPWAKMKMNAQLGGMQSWQ